MTYSLLQNQIISVKVQCMLKLRSYIQKDSSYQRYWACYCVLTTNSNSQKLLLYVLTTVTYFGGLYPGIVWVLNLIGHHGEGVV